VTDDDKQTTTTIDGQTDRAIDALHYSIAVAR